VMYTDMVVIFQDLFQKAF